MKKFLRRLTTYTALVVVIIAALNLVYSYRQSDGTEKMLSVPDGIQICNFGSSHGLNGFSYEDAEERYVCFNFGLGGQSLLYDNRILTHYRDKIRTGAAVFIVISHFSLFGLPDADQSNFLSKNRRYYTFLPPELIEHYDRKTDFFVNFLPALVSDNLIKFLETMLTMLLPPKHWEEDSTTHEDALKYSSLRSKAFLDGMNDRKGRRIRKHEAFQALYSMINICRQIGATPILITTPYLKEYNDAMRQNDPEFYADFHSVMSEVVSKTGVKHYDYSSDERYTNDTSLFTDADHLNRKGAVLFTDNILREILGINIQP